jgi:uncharacterized protein YcfL
MRRTAIIAITLLLAACGSSEETKVTETRMDDIDSLEGTISDEMVDTSELNEQPMTEAEPAAKPKAKVDKPEKADKPAEKPAAAPKLEVDSSVSKGE